MNNLKKKRAVTVRFKYGQFERSIMKKIFYVIHKPHVGVEMNVTYLRLLCKTCTESNEN